jgi:cytochrome c5
VKAKTWIIGAVALGFLGSSMIMRSAAQQPASGTGSGAAKSARNSSQEIVLPQYPPQMPPGPNLDAFQSHCLLCHSARYVTMQPRFSRAVWEKEVKKMVDAYGAPITPAEQQQIVDYLFAIKGPAEAK